MGESTDRIEAVASVQAQVGEGPAWDSEAGVLWWVDILAGHVHAFDPNSGSDRVWAVGGPIGAVVPRAQRGLALAMEHSVTMFDPDSGVLEPIAPIEAETAGNRVNDAKCDARGRFWVGTMAYDWQAHRGAGALYRVDPDGSVIRVLDGVTLSNGLAWSPDDEVFYHIDSATHRIDRFDFDGEAGRPSNRQTLMTVPAEAGTPDGLTVDADGYLWLALWGGGALWRIAPDDGHVDRVVDFPVSQVTSCAFGGADLTDLYVTSAAIGLSESELAEQPLAGGLFRFKAGTAGRPTQRFGG